MPTGYTAGIEDGTTTSLKEFALICARAMGACVMQREEPLSNPPRHREFSPYYLEQLANAHADLKELQSMSLEEAGKRRDAELIGATAEYYKYKDEHFRVRMNYLTMKRKVEAWTPPSKDYDGLKRFMLEQIELCMNSLYSPDLPKKIPEKEWLDEKREKAARNIGYYQVEIIKEKERVDGANKWLDQLLVSLDTPTVKDNAGGVG